MLIYKPGSMVHICNDISAKVIAVTLEGQMISYHVGYWNNAHWTTVWLPESEVKSETTEKLTLGFKNGTQHTT